MASGAAFASPDIFGASFGASPQNALNLTSGDPAYQQAILSQGMKNLQPAYKAALKQGQQDLANRGMDNSGLSALNTQSTTNQYLGDVGNLATQAATKGADVALQNKRIQQAYQHQNYMQQQQINAEKELQQSQQNQQQNQMAEQAVLGAATGVGGGLMGHFLLGSLMPSASSGASQAAASQPGGSTAPNAPFASPAYATAADTAINNGTASPFPAPSASSSGSGNNMVQSYLRALASQGYGANALSQLGALGPYGSMLGLQGLY